MMADRWDPKLHVKPCRRDTENGRRKYPNGPEGERAKIEDLLAWIKLRRGKLLGMIKDLDGQEAQANARLEVLNRWIEDLAGWKLAKQVKYMRNRLATLEGQAEAARRRAAKKAA
jgi:hypothetical protein